jgi:hypothetical protein
MLGYYLPIREGFCPDIYRMCRAALDNLVIVQAGIDLRRIEFYVDNDCDCNACAIRSKNKSQPHMIILNKGLIEQMTPEELLFVVGHEIGHLIFNHSYVSRTVEFVYPDKEQRPPLVRKLYDVWEKISEISADRVGFLACRNMDVSLKALFKLSSGLREQYCNMDPSAIIDFVEDIFREMKANPSYVCASHPANPVRIKALQLFYESALWGSIKEGKASTPNDVALDEGMEEVLSIVKKSPFTDQELMELSFTTAAGMLLMLSDGTADDEEYSYLFNILSKYIYWPPEYLAMMERANIAEVMKDSACHIVAEYPWRARDLLVSLFPIINRDNIIRNDELNLLMNIGVEELKLHPNAVTDIMLEEIRGRYHPLS